MHVQTLIDELRSFLPIQFPLGVFIHNNMLFHFEDRAFYQGVDEAAELFGAKKALPESYYLDLFRRKRIHPDLLRSELQSWLKVHGHNAPEGLDLFVSLMLNPLFIPLRPAFVQPAPVLTGERFRLARSQKKEKIWKRQLRERFGEDVNNYFHSFFIQFISTYLDQGMSIWHNPDAHLGLWESFRQFVQANPETILPWDKQLLSHVEAAQRAGVVAWLDGYLERLPFVENPRQYVLETLLELRGWAGMVNKFETDESVVPRFRPKISLVEYVAIYLLLEHSVYEMLLKNYSIESLMQLSVENDEIFLSEEQVQWVAAELSARGVKRERLPEMIRILVMLDESERAYIWQKALDQSVRNECLDALSIKLKTTLKRPVDPVSTRFYFCIDDREESIRRILEEKRPDFETHGVVGFFGIDMKFRSVHHPEAITHCPPVVNPSRVISEKAVDEARFAEKNKQFSRLQYGGWYSSRADVGSLPITILTGPVTSLLLFLRVFLPSLALGLEKWLRSRFVPQVKTRIAFSCVEGSDEGYKPHEMAEIVARILRFAGTVDSFPLTNYIIAHGSSSANNPFKNAYGCGACSGKAGFPNAQIFCGMANTPAVRDILSEKHQIHIPAEVFFVACYHDTSTDEVIVFNLDEAPAALKPKIEAELVVLRAAASDNSTERCRHFASARKYMSERVTLRHVLDRSASLAEPRPEYGHNNTAMTVIGRRSLTKGLFLDRRSFLTSYDYSTDPSGDVLAMVMAGAVPVAGGIALDYYFSRIDNEVYGSGTKLPLNIASLLGVMTGASSDLRIGLARQMVELHEPARNTIVVEAPTVVLDRLISAHPRIKKMVHNQWVHFASVDPSTGECKLFLEGQWHSYQSKRNELPVIADSAVYTKNHRGPLPFAVIEGKA